MLAPAMRALAVPSPAGNLTVLTDPNRRGSPVCPKWGRCSRAPISPGGPCGSASYGCTRTRPSLRPGQIGDGRTVLDPPHSPHSRAAIVDRARGARGRCPGAVRVSHGGTTRQATIPVCPSRSLQTVVRDLRSSCPTPPVCPCREPASKCRSDPAARMRTDR